MATGISNQEIESLRCFSRFYTRRIGVLDEGLLKSRFTLTQARVLFELGSRPRPTAGDIASALGLDFGYLSRILSQFSSQGMISRRKFEGDGRRYLLALTAKGRKAFGSLDRRSQRQASAMLSRLGNARRSRLLSALRDAQTLLTEPDQLARDRVVLRNHRLGDLGWAIELHARLYAEAYQWNEEFEALVAKLFSNFANHHDAARERCWVAELDGERVGCVFVARSEGDPSVAQLRCLLVDPTARGHGIGRRLVDECITFAKGAGYCRMILWTNDVLVAARRIYEAVGFRLVREERHHSFGHDLVGQFWSLPLDR